MTSPAATSEIPDFDPVIEKSTEKDIQIDTQWTIDDLLFADPTPGQGTKLAPAAGADKMKQWVQKQVDQEVVRLRLFVMDKGRRGEGFVLGPYSSIFIFIFYCHEQTLVW
jgi:hypothetical protein